MRKGNPDKIYLENYLRDNIASFFYLQNGNSPITVNHIRVSLNVSSENFELNQNEIFQFALSYYGTDSCLAAHIRTRNQTLLTPNTFEQVPCSLILITFWGYSRRKWKERDVVLLVLLQRINVGLLKAVLAFKLFQTTERLDYILRREIKYYRYYFCHHGSLVNILQGKLVFVVVKEAIKTDSPQFYAYKILPAKFLSLFYRTQIKNFMNLTNLPIMAILGKNYLALVESSCSGEGFGEIKMYPLPKIYKMKSALRVDIFKRLKFLSQKYSVVTFLIYYAAI